jgi:hypothetical protein
MAGIFSRWSRIQMLTETSMAPPHRAYLPGEWDNKIMSVHIKPGEVPCKILKIPLEQRTSETKQ